MGFDPLGDTNDVVEAMKEGIKEVKSGQITYAVRDAKFDDIDIESGDCMGLLEGSLVFKSKTVEETLIGLIEGMIDENVSILTVFYGDEITEETAKTHEALLEEKFSDLELEFHYGGQPVYSYIISIE